MEPLAFAFLRTLTPDSIETPFFDDRLEAIPFEDATNAVALSIGTFTARRAYQIAREFRQRGIPVIAGGFHPTLCPDEATRYVDSVVIGDAEDTWPQVVKDLQRGTLQGRYISHNCSIEMSSVDRSIFGKKNISP